MPIWAWILILIADFLFAIGISFLINIKVMKMMLKRFNPFSDPSNISNLIMRSTGKRPTKSKVRKLSRLLSKHKKN